MSACFSILDTEGCLIFKSRSDIGLGFARDLPQLAQTLHLLAQLLIPRLDAVLPLGRKLANDLG